MATWLKALKKCRFTICFIKPDKNGEEVTGELIKDTIRIQKTATLPEKIRTIIHEALHWTYPEIPDYRIYELEEEEWNSLSLSSLKKIVTILGDKDA